VTSIEKDPQAAALAARGGWPPFVDLRVGDALEVLDEAGAFDLVLTDAQGGKWIGLDRTIAALRPPGLLVVDDMTATPGWTAEQHTNRVTSGRPCSPAHCSPQPNSITAPESSSPPATPEPSPR
jgi:predicted O-methyltransferase YrrM